MRALAFSDLHRDVRQAEQLVEMATDADAVLGVGDFASVHEGLAEMVDALRAIEVPTVMVPGNNETDGALREACAGWDSATVLHGEATELGDDAQVFGLGAGVPTTPWDWSFDLTDEEAEAMLVNCPEGAVLAVHSPPKGHCDRSGGGEELGSAAILAAIEAKRPRLALCGHIHESWGCESRIGDTRVLNLGPSGIWVEI